MNQIPNYVRLTTNRYKGSITEEVASHYLKKKGFICEKFVLFLNKLGSVKYEQRKTKKLRQLFLEMAKGQLKTNREYWQRRLKEYSSRSPPKGWKEASLRGRTWAEVRKSGIKSAHNQMKAEEQHYRDNIEFEHIWGTHIEPIIDFMGFLREVNYTPDFIARKGEAVFVVEVKSKTKQGLAPLGEHQRKGLVKAYDYGLPPMLLVVPIDISIEIGEPKITVIKS